ncbi:MAG: hypothetical protein KBT63_11555 [Porticoccaceae bacterium]|nr:hypothetical protein [Porticoccaceae bacterium]
MLKIIVSLLPSFRRISLIKKLTFGVVAIIVISAAMFIVGYWFSVKFGDQGIAMGKASTQLTELIGELRNSGQEMRRQEKRFLLEDKQDALEKHRIHYQQIIAASEQLHVLFNTDENHSRSAENTRTESTIIENTESEGIKILQDLLHKLSDYNTFFATVVDSHSKIGFDDKQGIRAKLTLTLDQLENGVLTSDADDPTLMVSVLRLRQTQNEYLNASTEQQKRVLGTIGDELQALRGLISTRTLSGSVSKQLTEGVDSYQALWPELVALSAGMNNSRQAFVQAVSNINPMIEQISTFATHVRAKNYQEIQEKRRLGIITFGISLFIGALFVVFFGVVLARTLLGRIATIRDNIVAIANGDFTQDTPNTEWDDELGEVSQSIVAINANLGQVISKARQTSTQVAVASSQVLGGNTELSSRTQEQASSLEEVAASMEEMTGTVDTNAENATRAAELAKGAKDLASDGDEVASKTVAAMQRIEASNTNIAEVLELIQDFAFQTNLLALNAAVEAARAGEHGRGFGVVASEVRNLAGSSAKAAKDIKAMINESVKNINEGTELVNNSGNTLRQIVSSSSDVSDLVSEIAAASQEQSAGIQQVNRAVVEMDSITQQNAALVEEAAAASEAMGVQAQQLKELVAFFQLSDNDALEEQSIGSSMPNAPAPPSIQPGKANQLAARSASKTTSINRPGEDKNKDEEWSQF